MRILYVVGFSLAMPAGRVIGTQNKYRELGNIVSHADLFELSTSKMYGFLSSIDIMRVFAKFLAIIELNMRIFILGVLVKKWDVIICRDLPLVILPFLLIRKVKVIYEVHADFRQEVKLTKGFILQQISPVYSWLNMIIMKNANGIIFNHPLLESNMKENNRIKIPSKAVYNGADVVSFFPENKAKCRSKLGIPSNKVVLLFMGRVNVWHGVESLIDTFHKLKLINSDILLYIVGGAKGEYFESVKNRAGEEKSIQFIGSVTREESREYINASDICLLPVNNIRVSPGSPVKLYDYISCGKTVISQRGVRGYSDVVEENKLGVSVDFLENECAAREIVEYIDRYLELDEQEVSNRIRYIAENNLSWKNVITQWMSFIEGDC